jgi:hypothetical protein
MSNIENISKLNVAIRTVKGCGIGNILKGFISFLSLNENTKMLYDNDYLLGDYQNIFDKKHIIDKNNDTSENYSMLFSWRFLILKDEENTQPHLNNELKDFNFSIDINNYFKTKFNNQIDLFSESVAIDSFYCRKLISDNVYERIMKGIKRIEWNETIVKELNNFVCNIKFPMLGISVRTWEGSHENGVTNYRKYNFNDYKLAIEKIINNKDNIVNSIYISYDNDKVEPHFLELLKNFNVIKYKKTKFITELQYVTIKMLILSKCDLFICNRISTFSELVYWFNGCNQTVIDL